MSKRIFCFSELVITTILIMLAAMPPVMAQEAQDENIFILPCTYRIEVDDSGNTRTDQARLGVDTAYRRTWAEFDISPLKGKTVTDIGFRVFNDWSGTQITSLRYTSLQPSSAGSSLTGQHTFANKYDGFYWYINANDAWTPDENGFFSPGPAGWETWKRRNDGVNYKSIPGDLQDHINDPDRNWFAVEFDCFNCTARANLRLADNYFNPESIFMEVQTASAADADGDGHYPTGSSGSHADDCDDNDADVYPGAPELCDSTDNNCDGIIDEDGTASLTIEDAVYDFDQKKLNVTVAVEQCPGCAAYDNALSVKVQSGDQTFTGRPASLGSSANITKEFVLDAAELEPGLTDITAELDYEHCGIYTAQEQYTAMLFFVIEYNLGAGSGDETSPMTCSPVNFSAGNKYRKENDLLISGPGLPLEFARYYNSQSSRTGYLGYGWTGTFSESVIPSGGNMILWQADGAAVRFAPDGTGRYVSGTGQMRVIESSASGWRLTEPDGRTADFDNTGKLTRITDRNGNYQAVSYADGRPSHAEDNFGRYLDFIYNADGFLEFLDTPAGRFEYAYDQGNLIQAVRPDMNLRTYEYNDPHDPHNLTRIIDENGLEAVYEYDGQDRAVASEQIGGTDRITVVYEDGMTRRLTDSLGNTIVYELQSVQGIGRIRSSSGSCGSCPSRSGSEYGLSDRLNIQSKTDPLGNITLYTYDDRGSVLTKTEAAGTAEERTASYTWHPVYHLVTSVSRESVSAPGLPDITRFEYDSSGNLIRISRTGFSGTDTVTSEAVFAYDSDGQITLADGPRADVSDITRFEYYPNDPSRGMNRGMLKKISDPMGNQTLFADYNAWAKPGKITDPNGTITTLDYDVMGRVISKTVSGVKTSFEYNGNGRITAIHLPENRDIFYTYADTGLPERITDNAGNFIRYFYDPMGKTVREEIHDSSGDLKKYTDFEYDTSARLNRIIYPDGSSESRIYDKGGNPVRVSDANGMTVLYDYDALNRVIRVTQPGSVITGFSYDAHDNPVRITDAEGRSTESAHDDFGRRISGLSPDTGAVSYKYDTAGNPISKTDADGTVITYEYDVSNRLTAVHFPDQDITYTWDQGANAKGRLTGISDASGFVSYVYDVFGRVIKEEREIRGIAYALEYSYDNTGIMTGMTFPSGRRVIYGTDSIGRTADVSAEKDGIVRTLAENITYLPFGPAAGFDYGSGEALKYAFDQRYRLTRINDGSFQNLSYVYDPAGSILSVTDSINPPKSQAFSYDNLYRLISADGSYGNIIYTYDKTGNRLTRTENGLADTYLYEPGTNRLSQIAGENPRNFTYDTDGNTVSADAKTFTYNQNNRLVKALENGTVVGEYVYNALGQRVIKTSGGKITVFLCDQAGNLVAEADETGEILNEYIWLNGRLLAAFKKDTAVEAFVEIAPDTLNISSKGTLTCFIELPEGYDIADIIADSVTLNGTVHAQKTVVSDYNNNGIPDLTAKFDRQEPAAVIATGDAVTITVSGMVGSIPFAGTDTIKVIGKSGKKSSAEAAVSYEPANTSKETLYFYHTDHMGTPKLVTDINGNAVWKADYMPFGKADISFAKTGSDFRFPGQIFDAETGLHYNWNRYYDPSTGRYVTADPIGLDGGLNLYAYVDGNPVNRVDPEGLDYIVLQEKKLTWVFEGKPSEKRKTKTWGVESGKIIKGLILYKPIPSGYYYFSPEDKVYHPGQEDTWGPFSYKLHEGNLTKLLNRVFRGRDGGFHIHGGKYYGTAGCIEFDDYSDEQSLLKEFDETVQNYGEIIPLIVK